MTNQSKKYRGCKFFRFRSKFAPSPSQHDFQLRCLIEGKTVTFMVIASGETDIGKLKELIHAKGINPASSNIIKAEDLVLVKVDINISVRSRDSLLHLIDEKEVEKAERLEESQTVSNLWQRQPPDDRVHVFVKYPVVALSVGVLSFFRTAAPRVLPPRLTSDGSYVTIVPIDDGHFQTPVYIEVRPRDLIFRMHDRIRDELRAARFVGEFFRSNLPILPLPETPTISVLEGENLADLYTRSSQHATDLPRTMFSTFFKQFGTEAEQDSFQGVHFLVWLPPADRRFPEDPTLAISLSRVLNFDNATIASRDEKETQRSWASSNASINSLQTWESP